MSWVGAEPSSKPQSKQPRDACGNITVTQKRPLVPGLLSTWPWGSVTAPRSLWSCLHLGDHLSPRLHTRDSSHPHPHLCPRSPWTIPTLGTLLFPHLLPRDTCCIGHPRAGMSKHECSARRATGPAAPGDSPPNISASTGSAEAPGSWEAQGAGAEPVSLSLTDQPRALHQQQAHTALACFFFYRCIYRNCGDRGRGGTGGTSPARGPPRGRGSAQ